MEIKSIGKIENSVVFTEEEVKYVLYARKSTESDELQALSIDSQIKEMLQLAEREKLRIVEVRKEAHSAKASGERPIFKQILEDIRKGKFTGILTWAPDRLSRNAGDLGSVVDLMDEKKLIHIQTFSQKFTNDPSQKFLLMILCSQAKLENDNKSQNVKRGLRASVERGLWPAVPPTGYLVSPIVSEKGKLRIDKERAPIIKKCFEKIAYENMTGRQVYLWLEKEIKFRSKTQKKFSLGNFYRMLETTFYYGTFEFPKGSGNWYNGVHEPIISKELFVLTKEKIKHNILKSDVRKEFAFTRLLKCGKCGSGITCDEKFKKLKDGTANRHLYYKCSRGKDRNCYNKYTNENILINEFEKLIDQVDFNKFVIKEKISAEVERHKKFQQILLGEKAKITIKEIDLRNYLKFVLKEGRAEEKREVLGCFRGEFRLTENSLIIV